MSDTSPPVALTIAGSDSGGAAGIAADLTTMSALGVHATCAVTAITAQNTMGVQEVRATPAALVERQIESVLGDLPVAAVKTGMLASADVIALVADRAARSELPNLVVDPVMVASTGARLLAPAAEDAYRALLSHALIATPNLREASLLAGRKLTNIEDVKGATAVLGALGARYLVVTGGHFEGNATDLVLFDGNWTPLPAARIDTQNDHGSGCTFSAATASFLAHGHDPLDALRAAKRFVRERLHLSARWRLGRGRGPIGHSA